MGAPQLRIIFSISLTILVFCFLFQDVPDLFKENNISEQEKIDRERVASVQYKDLFKNEAIKKMSHPQFFTTKSKNPILIAAYKKDYKLLIYRMKNSTNIPLELIPIIEFGESSLSSNTMYKGYKTSLEEFSFSLKYDSLIKQIYIKVSGEVINKRIIGDSIMNFQLNLNNISFRYAASGPNDIIIRLNGEPHLNGVYKLKTDLLIYKKHQDIFIVFLYPKEKPTSLVLDSLITIIK